jgi:hypothetical protein
MQNSAAYRAKASDMRERARSAHDPVAYQELLSPAAQYEALVHHIELFRVMHKNASCSEPLHCRAHARGSGC